jgi:hypothetical protein
MCDLNQGFEVWFMLVDNLVYDNLYFKVITVSVWSHEVLANSMLPSLSAVPGLAGISMEIEMSPTARSCS